MEQSEKPDTKRKKEFENLHGEKRAVQDRKQGVVTRIPDYQP